MHFPFSPIFFLSLKFKGQSHEIGRLPSLSNFPGPKKAAVGGWAAVTMEAAAASSSSPTPEATFDTLGLDMRIRRALTRMRWARPTPVQRECVRLALEGKDVLARAPTGSGKTAGYVLPALHKLLKQRAAPGYVGGGIECVILVPTVELCKQVVKVFREIARYCTGESAVRVLGLAADAAIETHQTQLAELWHVVVATPGRLAALLASGAVALERSVHTLIIDEADLMLSYGYEEDTRRVVSAVPRICQSLLMSATLSDDVEELQKLVLHNPAVVDISDAEHGTASRLAQYYIRVPEGDKHLLLYTLLKLKVVPGKALIFVNDVEGCFKLKLFLDQFGIAAAALDSQLPHNSRVSIVEAFNKGIFDYLIATDESTVDVTGGAGAGEAAAGDEGGDSEGGTTEGDEDEDEDEDVEGSKKRRKKKQKLKEMAAKRKQKGKGSSGGAGADYNAARGLDFQRVSAVLNFDLPGDVPAYTHRIGALSLPVCLSLSLDIIERSLMITLLLALYDRTARNAHRPC
jgi:ATP-dependent RNA helicase DDX56/DBP9